MEMSRSNDQNRKQSPYMGMSRDNDQKRNVKSNSFTLQNHSLSFFFRKYSLLSATSVLSPSPVATASLDKLTCTKKVDLGKRQDRIGHFFPP